MKCTALETFFTPLILQYYQKARSWCCWIFISVPPFLWLPCFDNEPYIMYCFFVFSFYVFPFPTLSTACSYAFVTSALVFLGRAIHACINCFFHTLHLLVPCLLLLWMSVCYFGRHVQKRANYMDVLLACFLLSFLSILYFSNSMLVCVCYPGWRVFRTSHTCIFPFPLQLFQPLFRLASCFQNGPYMRSSVPFPTFPTAILYTFIISASVLKKSYGLTGPGTSLMRCSFTTWTNWLGYELLNEMQFHQTQTSCYFHSPLALGQLVRVEYSISPLVQVKSIGHVWKINDL